ncbi:HAD family hydrolase [Salinisphaera sp. SPP-AMP-43]|uniref:HAD family hydrolase n=1 Tax=Salinisphaera sp. SPP-AMP-43 TaxID=3121288 RepID=UPI003C6E11F3
MNNRLRSVVIGFFALTLVLLVTVSAAAPLPSWRDGPAKQSVIRFVDRISNAGSPAYVPEPERIAVFDNDGTLWSEKPLYFQFIYALDEVRRMAPQHPEWQHEAPFASILKGQAVAALAADPKALLEVVAATHAGMTTDAFNASVQRWLAQARHPRTKRAYTGMVYQPMLELLGYLRDNGFKTFIVSGGGIDFLRAFSWKSYGIPPEQVVGSSLKEKYAHRDGRPVLIKLPELNFIDDGPGKPVGIHQYIGRRPIFAAGNSDGDLQMLEWTTAGAGPRLGLIVHHTDAQREWAYDRHSKIGHLDKALNQAKSQGWTVVDMEKDWTVIYPPAKH